MNEVRLRRFCRRSPNDQFCQIILSQWRPYCLMDQIRFTFIFQLVTMETFFGSWLQLAQWYRRSCDLKQMVGDAKTPDARH